ncbi:hypothetical protein [Pinibacter aurantiacus]|uniref:Uncharacterized protein n=1 Tax=Pinibacter aurantiacus TaxID=2851599 RepID=A0A9E2W8L5_9BACT|nr:hypothetical protein [Pinibacter aurantiacus]MBV4358352.1 hypothetical protein [Pinibacter aurantiacus]
MVKKICDARKSSVAKWLASQSPHLQKAVLLLAVSFCFAAPLQSGNGKHASSSTNKIISQSNSDEQWTLAKSTDKVDIYYVIKDCKGQKTVFLKVDNKNNYAVKISWKEKFETQQKVTVEGATGKQLVLAAGETIQANCDNDTAKECVIAASQVTPAFKADVSKYDVANLSVSKN